MNRNLTDPSVHATQRVLIADDDLHVRQLLELTLRSNDYDVLSAADGRELVQLAQQFIPELIIADLMMPHMDGYEAIRQMRNDTRTAHIPMLILTARAQLGDVVVGFESGADDYIAKPFDVAELLARVKSHLRRAAQRPARNPLSGLPGGALLTQEIRYRLQQGRSLALLHADLDNFKAFNDTYGFSRGDRAILMVARAIQEALAEGGVADDFIGHIGGDDFVVLSSPERAERLCQAIINGFDRQVRQFYPADDWQRGYVSGTDRYGILRRFRLMTISIGVVTNQQRTFHDEEDLARVAAEVKQYAKMQSGSSYAIDKRVLQLGAVAERRAAWQRGVLLASPDASLRAVLHTALVEHQFTVYDAPTVTALAELTNDPHLEPALILADAQLGTPLWTFCAEWTQNEHVPLVVLTCTEAEATHAMRAAATSHLQQPLPLADVIACVERLTLAVDNRKVAHSSASYDIAS